MEVRSLAGWPLTHSGGPIEAGIVNRRCSGFIRSKVHATTPRQWMHSLSQSDFPHLLLDYGCITGEALCTTNRFLEDGTDDNAPLVTLSQHAGEPR